MWSSVDTWFSARTRAHSRALGSPGPSWAVAHTNVGGVRWSTCVAGDSWRPAERVAQLMGNLLERHRSGPSERMGLSVMRLGVAQEDSRHAGCDATDIDHADPCAGHVHGEGIGRTDLGRVASRFCMNYSERKIVQCSPDRTVRVLARKAQAAVPCTTTSIVSVLERYRSRDR